MSKRYEMGHWICRLTAVSMLIGTAASASAEVGADDEIYSSTVTRGDFEIESRAYALSHNAAHHNKDIEYRGELSYSPTSYWGTSVEAVLVDAPNEATRLRQVQFENRFQLTPTNRYWLDAGLLVAYEAALAKGAKDELVVGPILEKTIGRFVFTANITGSHELGNSVSGLHYGWRGTWRLDPRLRFGVEGFGERAFGNADSELEDNAGFIFDPGDRMGPTLRGAFELDNDEAIAYQAGVLFGVDSGASTDIFRLNLSYEF